MDTREDIRRRIKADAINLCTQVVNTAVEYKEEIIQLEKDNIKLKKENVYLKQIQIELKEQNKMLMKEIKERNKKLDNFIKRNKKICFNCFHSIICDSYLCIYCQKWVCGCCLNICKHQENDKRCPIVVCLSCIKLFPYCPKHSGNEDYHLLEYYEKNYFKNYNF